MSREAANANASGRLILVVDDDEVVLLSLCNLLESMGFAVTSAPDGRSALAETERRTPALVLTDIYMAGADGHELITALRRSHRTLPIIAMSGAAGSQEALAFARHLGADAVIAKPFHYLELVQTLDRLLRGDA